MTQNHAAEHRRSEVHLHRRVDGRRGSAQRHDRSRHSRAFLVEGVDVSTTRAMASSIWSCRRQELPGEPPVPHHALEVSTRPTSSRTKRGTTERFVSVEFGLSQVKDGPLFAGVFNDGSGTGICGPAPDDHEATGRRSWKDR